jgi:hypothetical protein
MQVQVVTGFPPQPDIIVPLLSHTFTALHLFGDHVPTKHIINRTIDYYI